MVELAAAILPANDHASTLCAAGGDSPELQSTCSRSPAAACPSADGAPADPTTDLQSTGGFAAFPFTAQDLQPAAIGSGARAAQDLQPTSGCAASAYATPNL